MLLPYLATHALRPFQRFLPDALWRVETDEPVVYLTFDDGPTVDGTPRLLEILEAYDARATHFLIGHHAEAHPDLVAALDAAGHAIGNHTYTHPDAWTTPAETVRTELSRTTMLLEDQIGRRVDVMRPPYGHPTGAMRTWCAERQQRMVMWDVMPGDFQDRATADGIAQFVLKTMRPGSIVVLHDNPVCRDVTPPALETILKALDRRGWRARGLDHWGIG